MNKIHNAPVLARLDLNLFQVFAMIYRERNLTRAAERLFVSPSAVSHSLARMREQLGDPLFNRDSQGVIPTPLANHLWPDIQMGLSHFERAITQSGNFEPKRDIRRIALAMNEELENIILPKIFIAMHDKVPEARIESVRLNRGTLKSDFAAGHIDFALDVFQNTTEGLTHLLMSLDEWVVVGRNSGPLDNIAYAAAGHVGVSSRRSGLVIEDFLLAQQGIQRNVLLRCQNYQAAFQLVLQSDLLLTLPRRMAICIGAQSNQLMDLPLSLPSVRLNLYWLTERTIDPGSTWLRNQLKDILKGAFDYRK